MHQPDPLSPTVPQQVVALPPPPPLRRNTGALAAFVGVAAALVGVLVGIAIGRSSSSPAPAAPPPPVVANDGGHVGVSSKPVDGNLTVDGRFVGVTPVERLDLDAGKHSVVIDAFGYQPYAGTLEVLPKAQMKLHVLLAPLGGSGATSGDVIGGKVITIVVPPSALLPPVRSAPPDEPRASKVSPRPAPAYEPPPRPRRDCDGEQYRCKDGCSRAHTDCDFSCPSCSSCMSNQTSEQCRQLCESCRSGCQQNSKFCESSCDTQHGNCEASQ